MSYIWKFIRVQFKKAPPVLKEDLTGKTVVVIGANTGLGLETAKHFASMNPERLVLGCRNRQKGEAALQTLGYDKAELRLIDLSKFSSVREFANTFEGDEKGIDILVMNAGIGVTSYAITEDGWESTLQVNDLATFYLSFLLLPSLKKARAPARLVVVASEAHWFSTLDKEVVDTPGLYEKLSDEEYCKKPSVINPSRYNVSKMFNVMFVRELAKHLSSTDVIVSAPCPAMCASEFRRDFMRGSAFLEWLERFFQRTIMFTGEEGARNFVYCALGKDVENIHGQFIQLSKVEEVSKYVLSEEGSSIQKRLWDETIEILTKVDDRIPDILAKNLS